MKRFSLFVALLFIVLSPLHSLGQADPVQAAPVITVRSALAPAPSASPCTVTKQSTSSISYSSPRRVYITPSSRYVSKTVHTPIIRVYRLPASKVNPRPVPEPTPTPVPVPTPTPEPSPAPVPAPGPSQSAMQAEMLGYMNAERAKLDLPALVLDTALSNGAYLKSKDMAENSYFSHTSPTYGSPFDMMKSLGITYRTAGENIAKNTSVKGAHEAFMNSTGHRENILRSSYGKVGLGFYQQGYYLYVTQWFTN